MILLIFPRDFAEIPLAPDRAAGSARPERWALAGPATAGASLRLLMTAEVLGLIAVGWRASASAATRDQPILNRHLGVPIPRELM